jgi:hypothetical protein
VEWSASEALAQSICRLVSCVVVPGFDYADFRPRYQSARAADSYYRVVLSAIIAKIRHDHGKLRPSWCITPSAIRGK